MMSSLSPFSATFSPRFKTPNQENTQEASLYARKNQEINDAVTPSSEFGDSFHKCDSDEDYVYMPVEVDLAKLRDWKDQNKETSDNAKKGELVSVNNTDVAVFKFGDKVLATQARCPHAGGPLHLGDIEVLPDMSLCVKCPWHKWTFCVAKKRVGAGGDNNTRRKLFTNSGSSQGRGQGECVWPPGRGEEGVGVKVYPTIVDKRRKTTIKIGFENFSEKTLYDSEF